MKKQFFISLIIIFTLVVVNFFLNNETKAATTCGEFYTQGALTYGTVFGADGKCWLDRNLGATQVATAYNDSPAYGWIFQWGRGVDGHQIPTSQVVSTKSSSDTPGHTYFILDSYTPPYDWRDPQNNNLWQGVNSINNPCPSGFRLPTRQEWTILVSSAGITNFSTAFNSSLKLTTAGYRDHATALYELLGYGEGYYWSSTDADALYFNYNSANMIQQFRATGFSVRCIADSATVKPSCTSWTYSDWSVCSISGQQTRTIATQGPENCTGGNPILSESCTYIPVCTSSHWSCTDWNTCSQNGQQTRTCNKIQNCQGGVTSPATTQSCTFTTPCTSSDWSCSGWSICAQNSQQTRVCVHTPRCLNGVPGPATIQSCSQTPACSADTWQCGNWGTCSPQGVQTRSCSRTYDCQSVETAAPATSQYCEAPNQPKQQTPSEDLGIVNQDTIIKATVKLICPVSATMASQGSGTVINSTGLILTNKHVIDGTAGCWVGFIDDYDDEPYFGDRQIADIYKVSSDADAAVLKLRNPSNKTLTSVNIYQSNSSNIKLGEILTTYGYPAKFGTKITYTSGDFSGVDGNYLKTTAIIEHGNSGGGAYLKNGAFIGIPTAVIKGSLNSMGYLLSVNKVNSWLNNSVAYNNNSSNNNYSRVSAMLEDMDLSAISSLGLFIAGDEANIKTATESQKVIAEEKNLITKIDNNLSKRVSGNILLQVESKGEGWYVNPDNKKKYYLGRPADAFSIMKNLGLGIKRGELANYLNTKFPSRLSGKIMLDVERNGEAYYINPKDLKGYFLNRPADAFRVMRDLGLGITNNDIRKIDVGEIK